METQSSFLLVFFIVFIDCAFVYQVHPMEPGKTLMNSFMFNIALVLLCVLVSA